MADSSSVTAVLEFLRKYKFTRAEAALCTELNNCSELNGFLENLTLETKGLDNTMIEEKRVKPNAWNQKSGSLNIHEVSKELIVKEFECGIGNGSERKQKSSIFIGEQIKPHISSGIARGDPGISNASNDSVFELCTGKINHGNSPADTHQTDSSKAANISQKLQTFDLSGSFANVANTDNMKSGKVDPLNIENKNLWLGGTSKAIVESHCDPSPADDCKDKLQNKKSIINAEDGFSDAKWSRRDDPATSSADVWKDCTVTTVLPLPPGETFAGSNSVADSDGKRGKKKDMSDIRVATKEQVDEVGRALYLGKLWGSSDQKDILDFVQANEKLKEDLPRLPPVRLKSEDKLLTLNCEEKHERDGISMRPSSSNGSFHLGSYLEVPVGQDINSLGGKSVAGGNWLSVSHGIAEDTSNMVSGFATIGDGLSESMDCPNEYWDSDGYEDDDDVGYMRQPIEDEEWFLAHELDYPSDNEKGIAHESVLDPQEQSSNKDDNDDRSFAEEDSCLSGHQCLLSKNVVVTSSDHPMGLPVTEVLERPGKSDLVAQKDRQLMDEEKLNWICAEPVWQGFITETDELTMLENEKLLPGGCRRPQPDDACINDDQQGSVRSIGVGISSNAAYFGSERWESLMDGGSEGDLEYSRDCDVGNIVPRSSLHDTEKRRIEGWKKDLTRVETHESSKYVTDDNTNMLSNVKSHADGGFSFPQPLPEGQLTPLRSSKSLWSSNLTANFDDETTDSRNIYMGTDDTFATWRRKSSGSSSKSSKDENNENAERSAYSSSSSLLNYECTAKAHSKEDVKIVGHARKEPLSSPVDEETAAVQEQVRQIKAQEEEFETFNLKIVHRKNRTGFEEDKNFHVALNSVIAGRYHVTEYLGSAAFSKAVQAHDLCTGMDVCIKIIKNNKDFFDQSLDEIKLLKYVNKHDPADRFHLLRLYDYFYYREHLLIVCELLKANLYEFQKFNRESGGEVYFTMPRIQSITVQCLEALQFLHGLGLIHCDLKPENILVKSYSRCEIKVIDLGSSCFETDHLCSYVQSRSYRAPEVILGLPYSQKIDIWSLGCILAELCTGNVLFQNDSPAALLARVIGIIGMIDQGMLARGRDTYKYFTKNYMLYERNQETNKLEYLMPKKSSLRYRLSMGDQGFIDFVSYLLAVNPEKRPTAAEALKHPWLSYPYEPISS